MNGFKPRRRPSNAGASVDLNLWERRHGVDQWPEANATVTSIEQPYNNKESFLSVITFSFKDQAGEYFSGTFQMRTRDFADDFMTGSTVTIRRNPANPNKTWYEGDYSRSGFGLWQGKEFLILMFCLVVILILAMGVITVLKRH